MTSSVSDYSCHYNSGEGESASNKWADGKYQIEANQVQLNGVTSGGLEHPYSHSHEKVNDELANKLESSYSLNHQARYGYQMGTTMEESGNSNGQERAKVHDSINHQYNTAHPMCSSAESSSPSVSPESSVKRELENEELQCSDSTQSRSSSASRSKSRSSSNKRARQSVAALPEPIARRDKPKGELLSKEERKANHIACEKKRREAIRTEYSKIVELVPGLDVAHSRSEALVLEKTVDYLHLVMSENRALQALAEAHAIPISTVGPKRAQR